MKPAPISDADASLVDKAVSLWRAGALVAFPTETVYGLGADATNAQAVAKIYTVKERPRFNPLIVHVADIATAKRYVQWNTHAEQLAAAFWPGALTLVLKRKPDTPIADLVSAGGDTIAIRVPGHRLAQALLRAFDGGIAAPSANRSGRISPTLAAHVRSELGDAPALIIDGGACEVGLESTVVDVSGENAMLLRLGSITHAMIEEVIKDTLTPTLSLSEGEGGTRASGRVNILKSPGQLEKHYAPNLPIRINAQEVKTDEALLAFGASPLKGAAQTINLSPTANLIEAAANLFAALRELDDPRYRAIAVMPVPNEGIGEAINDRLQRAAVR